MSMDKRAVITEETPGVEKTCSFSRCKGSCKGTKQAEEATIRDPHPVTALADAASNAFKK